MARDSTWCAGVLQRTDRRATRTVVVTKRYAFKFARHRRGMGCNQSEAHTHRSTTDQRRSMLCPVLWCSGAGLLLIARRATLITEAEAAHFRATWGFPDWDYAGPGDQGCPFESKAANWGWLDNRLVALDYAED
jgi:hypothetical protein